MALKTITISSIQNPNPFDVVCTVDITKWKKAGSTWTYCSGSESFTIAANSTVTDKMVWYTRETCTTGPSVDTEFVRAQFSRDGKQSKSVTIPKA